MHASPPVDGVMSCDQFEPSKRWIVAVPSRNQMSVSENAHTLNGLTSVAGTPPMGLAPLSSSPPHPAARAAATTHDTHRPRGITRRSYRGYDWRGTTIESNSRPV